MAGPRLAYTGTQISRVSFDGADVRTTIRVTADGAGGMKREYLDGPAKGIVLLQIGAESWRRSPDGVWQRLPNAVGNPKGAAGLMARNYRISKTANQPMLGRRLTAITVAAKRSYLPSRTIWFEDSTGIVFRDRLTGPTGALRSESTLTKITLVNIARFQPPVQALEVVGFGPSSFHPTTRDVAEERSGLGVPAPKYVPPGFTVANYGVITAGSGRTMPAVRYFDGLASFTIFRRGRMAGFGAGSHNPPRSDSQQSVVAVQRNAMNYLLIGDIAESELQKVASSL